MQRKQALQHRNTRTQKFISLVLSLVFGWSSTVSAQVASTEPPLTLSIQDAVRIAIDQNPNILSDREKLEEQDKNISLAISQIFPSIVGSASATKQKSAVSGVGTAAFGGEPYNQYIAQLKLTQPLYVGGALSNGLSAQKREKEIRQKTLEIDTRNLTLQVLEAFYTVLTNQQVLEILKQTKTVEEQTVATSERYYKIGRAQLLDVLQAKTTLALLLPQISTAENQMKSAASQLTTLLHESQAKSVKLLGPIAYIDPARVTQFLAKRKELPEIVRGQTQISAFHNQAEVQKAVYRPNLSLQAIYGKQSFTQTDLLNDYSNTWTVSLQLSVPIFSGLASVYQRSALASQEAQLEYSQVSLLDQLSFNQVQAERNLDVASAVLKSSKEASDLSKASLKEAQRDFKLQTINYLQLLTSQQNFLSAQSTYVQAQYSYIDSVAKYFVASGIPIEELIGILNQ